MENVNPINWYPGHMAKAKREIGEALPLVDAVIELLDSRLPVSSQNPDFFAMFRNKPSLTLLTKSSLCDPSSLPYWKEKLAEGGRTVLSIDCKQNRDLSQVTAALKRLCAAKLERDAAKNVIKPLRCLVVGITNVGKSTFINTYTNTKKAKVEDRPGVTRQNQWIAAPNGIELLDTPGLLWPKLGDESVGVKLAAVGSIRDDILDMLTLAYKLLDMLKINYSACLAERYGITASPESDTGELFEAIGKKRGFLRAGGIVDEDRTAACILDEFRGGKMGRITLD